MNEKIVPIMFRALVKTLIGMVIIGAMLFLIAGTLAYRQAWIMVPSLMIPMGISGTIFKVQNSGILERRNYNWGSMSAKRKLSIIFKYIATLGLLIVPAIDYRFGWSSIPLAWAVVGAVMLISANVIWIVSKTANPFAGSGIELYEGHELCKTGPYSAVRHPNYLGDLLLIFGIPLALGSLWGLVSIALLLPLLVERTLDEEDFLRKHLPGYEDYMQEVRWRFIPLIW